MNSFQLFLQYITVKHMIGWAILVKILHGFVSSNYKFEHPTENTFTKRIIGCLLAAFGVGFSMLVLWLCIHYLIK